MLRFSSRPRCDFAPHPLPALAFGLLSSVSCGVAIGQSQDSEREQGLALEEVTVTAQRRVERLQDVPLSAVVVSGDALVNRNVNTLSALSQAVPAVHVGAGGTRTSYLTIRGVGSGNNQSFDQAVGLFSDEIYHGRSRLTAATFLDVENVEILKGPQSTFFGNNVIAGAINIATRKPGDTWSGSVRALYGEYGQYAFEGAAGGPINDVFGVRVAAALNGQDGWIHNINTDQDYPQEENAAGRITFTWRPSDALDASLKVERAKSNQKGGLSLLTDRCPPPAPFTAAGFCALAQGLRSDPDRYELASSSGEGSDFDIAESVLKVDYTVLDHTLTSITGYYDYDFGMNVDVDFTPQEGVHGRPSESYDQWSQEFRLVSPTGRALEYVAGVYYQTDDLASRQDQVFAFRNSTISGNPALAALVPYLPLANRIDYRQDEQSYAAFASLTWNITDRWRLTTGLRRTWVEKDYDWQLQIGRGTGSYGGIDPLPAGLIPLTGTLGMGTPGVLSGSREDGDWLPSAKLQYQFAPDIMAYASYSDGFKAGGFNGVDITGVAANLPFDPETVRAYEVGIKSKWFDDRVLVNAAAYWSDYSNLQVTQSIRTEAGASINLVRNAGKSRSRGAELESSWQATRNLRIDASVAYTDSYYLEYANVAQTILGSFCRTAANTTTASCIAAYGGLSPATQDLAGRQTLFAPTWSGTAAGSYRFRFGNGMMLTPEIRAIYSSQYYTEGTLDPLLEQDAYLKWEARLTLAAEDERWQIDLIGKNLTDEMISTFGSPWANSLGSVAFQFEPRRSVAVQARMNW